MNNKSFFIIGLFFLLLSACGGGGKASGTNTTLSALSLESGGFEQIFQSNQFSYTATVGSLLSTISVTPTATDSGAQIRVNGIRVLSGQPSPQIRLEHGANTIFVVVSAPDNQQSTYVLTVKRLDYQRFSQRGLFKASNTGAGDLFGVSVAIDGDTLAIGAPFESSSVANVPNDNTALAAGAVYVFTFSNNVWREQARIKASNAQAGDHFGEKIALQGDTLVIGAPQEDGINNAASNAGAVYVYQRSGLTWAENTILHASNAGSNDLFGSSLSLSSNILVVGAPGEASSILAGAADNSLQDAGAAYVFELNNNTWVEQTILKASNAEASDLFGGSIDIFDNTIVIGATGEDSSKILGASDNSVSNSGAAYVFLHNTLGWEEQAILKASNFGVGDEFGKSVSVFQDTVAVGAYFEDSSFVAGGGDNLAPDSGAVYVFVRNGTTWTQQSLIKASNADSGDNFGVSLALRGDSLVVGAWAEDSTLSIGLLDNSASASGIVYVFDRFQGGWSEQKVFKPTNSDPGDLFGASVAISNNRMLAAAIREDSPLLGPDTLNLVPDSGAAYIVE